MANWWTCLTRSHLVGSARKAGTATVWWPWRCLVVGRGARRWWSKVFASVWSEAYHLSRLQEPELQPEERLAMLCVPGTPWRQFPAAVRKNIDFRKSSLVWTVYIENTNLVLNGYDCRWADWEASSRNPWISDLLGFVTYKVTIGKDFHLKFPLPLIILIPVALFQYSSKSSLMCAIGRTSLHVFTSVLTWGFMFRPFLGYIQ